MASSVKKKIQNRLNPLSISHETKTSFLQRRSYCGEAICVESSIILGDVFRIKKNKRKFVEKFPPSSIKLWDSVASVAEKIVDEILSNFSIFPLLWPKEINCESDG